MRVCCLLAMTCVLLAMACVPTWADWTVTTLHPVDGLLSNASAVFIGGQAGYVKCTSDGSAHASLWNGGTDWIDLHPAGAYSSYASGIAKDQQVGWADFGWPYFNTHAVMWSGSASGYVDLNPKGASRSFAMGTDGTQQVGCAGASAMRAGLWTGSAESWVELFPGDSVAYGVSGGQQVGSVYSHATLWRGTAASRVDLNPVGAGSSEAIGVSDGEQVGWAILGGFARACLWRGTAQSYVDLNPAGAWGSGAYAVSGGWQAGLVQFGDEAHAGIWHGTADSWQDLDSYLPSGVYSRSWANGIYANGDELVVVGFATDAISGQDHAIMWSYAVPEPGCVTALVVGVCMLAGFIRPRRT